MVRARGTIHFFEGALGLMSVAEGSTRRANHPFSRVVMIEHILKKMCNLLLNFK